MPIMMGNLIFYKFYKVNLNNPSEDCQVISFQAMTAGTSKLTANLSIWHHCFAYLNKSSTEQLIHVISCMVIAFSSLTFSFWSVCVKAKNAQQQNRHVERFMPTIVKGPRAKIINSGLFLEF